MGGAGQPTSLLDNLTDREREPEKRTSHGTVRCLSQADGAARKAAPGRHREPYRDAPRGRHREANRARDRGARRVHPRVTFALLALLGLLAGCAWHESSAVGLRAVVDHEHRIIWAEDHDTASEICWRRYGMRGYGCHGPDDVTVLARGSDLAWHERCHMLGWGRDHPKPIPAQCMR